MNTYPDTSSYLKAICNKGGYGAKARLAAELGILPSYLSHLLSGKRQVGDKLQEKIQNLRKKTSQK